MIRGLACILIMEAEEVHLVGERYSYQSKEHKRYVKREDDCTEQEVGFNGELMLQFHVDFDVR